MPVMPYYADITGADQGQAPEIIKKVAPHIPVSAPAVRASPSVVESLVRINVTSAKMFTRFLTSSKAQVHSALKLVYILCCPFSMRVLPLLENAFAAHYAQMFPLLLHGGCTAGAGRLEGPITGVL